MAIFVFQKWMGDGGYGQEEIYRRDVPRRIRRAPTPLRPDRSGAPKRAPPHCGLPGTTSSTADVLVPATLLMPGAQVPCASLLSVVLDLMPEEARPA